MNSETVKPMPPSAASPQTWARRVPSGSVPSPTADRGRSRRRSRGPCRSAGRRRSPTPDGCRRRQRAGPPPNCTPALARAKSGTIAKALIECSRCSSGGRVARELDAIAHPERTSAAIGDLRREPDQRAPQAQILKRRRTRPRAISPPDRPVADHVLQSAHPRSGAAPAPARRPPDVRSPAARAPRGSAGPNSPSRATAPARSPRQPAVTRRWRRSASTATSPISITMLRAGDHSGHPPLTATRSHGEARRATSRRRDRA